MNPIPLPSIGEPFRKECAHVMLATFWGYEIKEIGNF